jgi:hypothetical protein
MGVRRVTIGFGRRLPEFPGRTLQFTAQYSHVTRRREGYRYSIPGDPPDLDCYVVADMNPFTNFPAEN